MVEVNYCLGFEDDEWDFCIGVGILCEMGFSVVWLMMNNLCKVDMLVSYGIVVIECVLLIMLCNWYNIGYLDVKVVKLGYLL